MGSSASKVANDNFSKHQEVFAVVKDLHDLKSIQHQFDRNTAIDEAVIVAHYTPAGFPLIPIVSERTQQICKESWAKIVAGHQAATKDVEYASGKMEIFIDVLNMLT
jgi:phage host-nuclease inhibitor protein Gam